MATAFEQVKASVVSILGSSAKIPPPKADTNKLKADWNKAADEFHASVDALQKKILALQNIGTTTKNIVVQHQELVAASDFGLDEDAPGMKDKLAKAHKLFGAWFDERKKILDSSIRNLDELDKHSISMANYKSPT